MVLRILIILLMPTLCFSNTPKSMYLDLKKSVEVLESEGTSSLNQEKVDGLKEQLSNVEDLDPPDFDELEDRLDKILDAWTKKRLKGGWNIFIGLTTWTYSITVPISRQEIFSDEIGACGGGGYDWQNHWYGFGVDLCLGGMSGKSSIKLPLNITLNLELPVFMMASRPKLYWRPDEHTKLVFYLPLIYRYGFSTDPLYPHEVKGGKFSVGFFLGGEWEIVGIVLGSSFGKIIGFESASWNFTFGYRF